MSDDLLLAQYPRQSCVRDRNYSGLLRWSAYIMALPLPPTTAPPTEDNARLHIMAERMPTNVLAYVDRTTGYFLQDPATINNIRLYLSPWNDDPTEQTLSDEISAVISAFMPKFAASEINDTELAMWYAANGYPVPSDLPQPMPMMGMPMMAPRPMITSPPIPPPLPIN